MAPEVIRGTGHGTYVGSPPRAMVLKLTTSRVYSSADIWSLGCTIIEMLTAVTPYSKFAEVGYY